MPLDETFAPKVSVLRRRGYYHEWAAGQPSEEEESWRPDLVVAFNSGAHTLDSHLAIDGSLWTPTLELLDAKGWPTVLTCYDEKEGDKTRGVMRAASLVWGPELNPVRSLALEEGEPPEAHRFGELMMVGGGQAMSEKERLEAAQRTPLDLETCNHTSASSRIWLGFRGGGRRGEVEGEGAEENAEEKEQGGK